MSTEEPFDPYKILGVSETATVAQIKRAFKKRAKEAHPDRGGSAEAMATLNEAYAILTDLGKREAWDRNKNRGGALMTQEHEDIALMQTKATMLLLSAIQNNHTRLETTDLRAFMLNELSKERQALDHQEKDEQEKLKKFNIVKLRWEIGSGSFNYMVAAVESQMQLVENALKSIETLRGINTRTQAMVMTHRYNFDTGDFDHDFGIKESPNYRLGNQDSFRIGTGFGRR